MKLWLVTRVRDRFQWGLSSIPHSGELVQRYIVPAASGNTAVELLHVTLREPGEVGCGFVYAEKEIALPYEIPGPHTRDAQLKEEF
jgi:hypothetical protein